MTYGSSYPLWEPGSPAHRSALPCVVRGYSVTVMLTADGPLGPVSRSNDTVAPSSSESKPAACTAVMCMNTSRSSVCMNPKPFCGLNHFTVPDLLIVIYSFLLFVVVCSEGVYYGVGVC